MGSAVAARNKIGIHQQPCAHHAVEAIQVFCHGGVGSHRREMWPSFDQLVQDQVRAKLKGALQYASRDEESVLEFALDYQYRNERQLPESPAANALI